MQRIQTNIDVNSKEFKENETHMKGIVAQLDQMQQQVRYERPERDMKRIKRQNKMFVRDRLELLLDPGTPFLELSTLSANMKYDGSVPSAGIISGVGIVSGREVIIHAEDATVKGGAWYPLTVKKIVRLLDIAIENRLPVIHLSDSAGGFLPEQSELFPDRYNAGRIFRNKAILSKLGIPQLSIVLGHCTAGGAYIPGMSDYSVIIKGTGAVFLGGPPLVKAATGEIVTVEDLGGCDMHTQISGAVDYPAQTEPEGIAIAREIMAQIKRPQKYPIEQQEPEAVYYNPEELYGILPKDTKVQYDMREVIARIVDGSRFHEYQPAYGTTIVCGYAHIWGYKVGILANNGVLFNDSSLKAAHFIQLCDQNQTPLVFLQNITGFIVGRDYEMRGITKDGSKMIMAQAGAEVPKFTIMCGGSFGAGNYGMCGRAYDARFLFTWPKHQISVMGGEQAANVLTDIKVKQLKREGKNLSPKEIAAIREPVLADYERQSSAYYSTSEIWDDGLIDPVGTRNALGIAISASLNTPIKTPHYGVFRM